jgi:ParB-like nuclease domain
LMAEVFRTRTKPGEKQMSDDRTGPGGAGPPKRIPFHPLSNTFPMMPKEKQAELAADIKENGQHQPITLYEDQILDGRNRFEACLLAGVAPVTEEYTGDDPLGFVISANVHRRHLTQAQKQEIVAKLLAEHPKLSDRAIGKLAYVDHKTVGAKRAAMEACGELPHLARRADSRGRPFRADKKTRTRRSSARLAIGSMTEDEEPEANTVLAFARLLNEGDIKRRLNILLGVMAGEPKKRIAALPIEHEKMLARGFFGLFGRVRAEDLRPVEYVPVMEGALLPRPPRDLPEDGEQDDNAGSASAPDIESTEPSGTLH